MKDGNQHSTGNNVMSEQRTEPTAEPRRDNIFPTPWRYEGYGYIHSADGAMVAELRGWGHLTGTGGGRAIPPDEAAAIQDRIGRELCEAWNRYAATAPEHTSHLVALEEAAIALMQLEKGPAEPRRNEARVAVEAYLRALGVLRAWETSDV